MAITVELPESIEHELARVWSRATLSRKVTEALVIEAYRKGLISRGKLGELLGMSFHAREAFLKERDVPYNYDAEDLAKDVRAVNRIVEKRQ